MSEAMTTTTSKGAGLTYSWLKGGLLGALAFVVCWGGAISFWRSSDRMPATWELVVYLFGLPVVILVAIWLGHRTFAARQAPAAVAAPAAAGAPGAGAVQTAGLAILAASIRSPHGSSPDELAAAIENHKARPDLDEELVDEDGFPVMTARCSDATDEELQAEITEWFEENGISTLNFNDENWRALTLATAVTQELASYAASELLVQPDAVPKLQLIPIVPSHWSTEHHLAACMWLKHTARQCGWQDKQIGLNEEVLARPDPARPSGVFAQLARDIAAAADAPTLAIVIAFSSNICDETVAHWAESGSLFSSSRTEGAIPGEGAAGLLVSDLNLARTIRSDTCVVVGGMDEARLDSSAEKTRRLDPRLVRELTERVLSRVKVDFSDIAKIVADTDHRSKYTLELMGSTATKMPQLDEAEDVVRVGVATGSCGDVPFMAALVLARHHALELKAPVLAISNGDAYHRVAALVKPASWSPKQSGVEI
jgi:hypothetical protein